ncbi:MAG: transcription termination/antitermination protein NusG [Verrucomicrobiota bacterium]
MQELDEKATNSLAWYVAHTRPRCEKKLAEYCRREGLHVTLPLYKSVKKYEGKTAVFEKPLFPNYLFLQLQEHEKKKVYQNDYLSSLLNVPDQQTFQAQLEAILAALDSEYEMCAMPQITEGKRVRIRNGALCGLEGFVEDRQGKWLVLLRLDFIGRSAGVRVDANDLELLS